MNEQAMMHGSDWDGEDLTGYVLTEKCNGCRAFWDGEKLWSRGGMSPVLPAEWAGQLPAIPLDCELYDGTDGVYRCGAALRYGKFTPSMRLVVFDAPGAAGDYKSRMDIAAATTRGSKIAQVATLTHCQGNHHALRLLREIQARGGEGVMAYLPALPYRAGRSRNVLKIKHEIQ